MSEFLPIIIAAVFFVLIAGGAGVFFVLREGARKKAVLSKIKGKNAASKLAKDDPEKRRAEISKKLKCENEEAKAKKKTTIGMMI
ncbi:MAG: hypothetical protein ACRBCT_08305, partial [Alphaproteobacteria bacterium]